MKLLFYISSINLGTLKCKKDYDCGKNMECLGMYMELDGICYCNENFYPAPGNQYCISSKVKELSNCVFFSLRL